VLHINPEWHYIGFWYMLMPNAQQDYFATLYQEEDDEAYKCLYRIRDVRTGQAEWQAAVSQDGYGLEDALAWQGTVVETLRAQAGGGELNEVITDCKGHEAYELLLKQDWCTETSTTGKIIIDTHEEPDYQSLLAQARKTLGIEDT